MIEEKQTWLPIDLAAKHFGYLHPESLRRRLRYLREQGFVADIGNPPSKYPVASSSSGKKIILYWPNPRTALIKSNAPTDLLNPKMGKRQKKN